MTLYTVNRDTMQTCINRMSFSSWQLMVNCIALCAARECHKSNVHCSAQRVATKVSTYNASICNIIYFYCCISRCTKRNFFLSCTEHNFSTVMKWFVICFTIILPMLTPASKAYQHEEYQHKTELLNLFDALTGVQVVNDKTSNSLDETAESEQFLFPAAMLAPLVVPAVTKLGKWGIKAGSKALKYIAGCPVCKNCTGHGENADLQQRIDAGLDDDVHGKLMTILKVMQSVNAIEEKLNKVKDRFVKDNRVAEAQFLHWISDKLKRARQYVKRVAKKIICT